MTLKKSLMFKQHYRLNSTLGTQIGIIYAIILLFIILFLSLSGESKFVLLRITHNMTPPFLVGMTITLLLSSKGNATALIFPLIGTLLSTPLSSYSFEELLVVAYIALLVFGLYTTSLSQVVIKRLSLVFSLIYVGLLILDFSIYGFFSLTDVLLSCVFRLYPAICGLVFFCSNFEKTESQMIRKICFWGVNSINYALFAINLAFVSALLGYEGHKYSVGFMNFLGSTVEVFEEGFYSDEVGLLTQVFKLRGVMLAIMIAAAIVGCNLKKKILKNQIPTEESSVVETSYIPTSVIFIVISVIILVVGMFIWREILF